MDATTAGPTRATPPAPAASTVPTDPDELREHVRRRYAAAAGTASDPATAAGCCGEGCGCSDGEGAHAGSGAVFGGALYGAADRDGPEPAADALSDALSASLGCGVPTAVADLHPGEVVLDLGSGAGADVLISARRVAPGGRVIGLDMTEEMLELARRNATAAGADNVSFVQGYLEDVPLPDASVDVVISNCVLNLAADKAVVLREAARVLRPGGRLAVTDVVADPGMDPVTRADMQQWTGCVAGALTVAEMEHSLAAAGFTDVTVTPTHRVHTHAASAVVRARRP